MSQVLVIKNKGLHTNPNEFSSVPEGALLTADNCSIDKDNVIEPRRGLNRLQAFASGSDRARRYALYQSTLIAAYSNGKIAYDNAGTWSNYSGTYNDPDANLARLRFLNVGANLYFTSSGGVYRLDAYNGTPALSGVPKGLDINLALTGASGFISNNSQVAYRVLWGFKDSNNTVFLGAPSGRAVIANTSGGTRNTTVRFTIPSSITTSFFFQVYRSANSSGATTEPSDELGLVYENNPSAGDITNGYVEFTDSTIDSLRGATLYTSPSQEGIIASNERPPLANDIALFQNCTFYADCKSKHRKTLTILSTSGLSINDTITIAGTVYTAKGAETIASGQFQLFTGGSPASDIASTADSLIRVINRYTSNTSVYATLLSGQNDLPGQILIEERGIGGSSFAITASAGGTSFNPVLPTSGTSVSSTADDFSHQVFFSKTDKPEAVPLLNYLFVGSQNNRILRIMPLKNSLFVFKENEGIYRITGTDPSNFVADLFDSSARLLAPDSVDVVNNQVWALSDQGVITVTETGVSVISRPIEDLVLEQTGLALTQLKYYSFGVGYETDRRYILWTVSSSSDTTATQAFAWNTFTRTFTRWDKTATAAFVSNLNNKLYVGEGNTNYTLVERKTLTYADFVDHEISVTISSFSGMNIVLSSVSNVEVGDILLQGSFSSIITAISSTTVTVADDIGGWTAAAATVLKSYTSTVEYAAITGGNPGVLKQFPELSLLFRSARFNYATLSFATDISGSFEEITISGSRTGLWGLFPWGQSVWGSIPTASPIRVYIPLEKQYGSLLRVKLSVKQGYAPWQLNGFSLPFRETKSTVIGR